MDPVMIVMDDGRRIDFAGAYVPVQQGKIDVALSMFAKSYQNNAMIGDNLFPPVEVNNQSDKFWVWGRENQQIFDNQDLRAPASAAERIRQTLSTSNYTTTDHSLARLIPDEERGNFQAGDLEQWATQFVKDKLALMKENRVAQIATNTANYDPANSLTLAGTSQWSDYTNSDPGSAVETAKQQLRRFGITPNILILGDDVFMRLRNHPKIRSAFTYVIQATRPLVEADLAAYFGVDRVVVGSAVTLSATFVPTFLWGKNAVLANVQAATSMQDLSFGKTFVWRNAPGTTGGYAVETGRITPPSAKADELAVHWYYGIQVTSNISAFLWKNAVA